MAHVDKHPGDAIESGPAALAPDADHLLGPDLPFPGTVGPEHAVAHRGWREACDRALSAVLAGPGLVLVLGPPGTGKTLLLQHLARVLRASGVNVLLSTRGDLDVAEGQRAENEIVQPRVVLIDEADRLSAESMERLGRLGRCTFVLAGVMEPREDDRPVAREGTTVIRLAALAPEEVGPFVAVRLAQAGLRSDLLTEAAIDRLGALSDGLPRVLNMLTGSALFLARTAHAACVDAAHVIEAAALRGDEPDLSPAAPAEPSPPAAPPSDRPPGRALTVVTSGKPLRAPAIMLSGASPSRSERTRPSSPVVLAGLLATAGLAAACVWLFIHPGQPAVSPPKVALVSAPPGPSPLPAMQPERGPGATGTMSRPSATPPAVAAPREDGSVQGQNARSTEAGPGASGPKSGAGHRSDRRRTWRGGPRPEASASRNGTLGLGERVPVEASRQHGGSQSRVGAAPPPPASAEHRVPKYVGIYTTGPDGVRTFRASP